MIIVVGVILYENKYYPQVKFFDECFHEIMNNMKMLYYHRVKVSERIDVNKTSEWK